ncbi:MAG TPA: AraC family transcriptional regulator [Armatimonadota bacterium]
MAMEKLVTLWYNITMADFPIHFEKCAKEPDCSARIDSRFVRSIGLEFVEQRAVELFEDGRRYLLEGPSIWLTWPERQYRYHPAPGCANWLHRYVRFFGPRAVEWEQHGLLPFEPQPLADGVAMGQRLDQVIALSQEVSCAAHLRAANLLEAVLLDLADWRATRHPYPAWLRELLSCIQAREVGAWDETAFAQQYGMSLVTLRRHFRQLMGLPLHAYILRVRLQRARILLEETPLPLKAIAEQLGYCDTYYFQQQFRQLVGVTPAQYRKHLPISVKGEPSGGD